MTTRVIQKERPCQCVKCRHYSHDRKAAFPCFCRALEYAGKRPPATVVFSPAHPVCDLFAPVDKKNL